MKNVACELARLYSTLLKSTGGVAAADRYAEFQIRWVHCIRELVETAEKLAYSDAQPESDFYDTNRALCDQAAEMMMSAFSDGPYSDSTLYSVFHAIAREVYIYSNTSKAELWTQKRQKKNPSRLRRKI